MLRGDGPKISDESCLVHVLGGLGDDGHTRKSERRTHGERQNFMSSPSSALRPGVRCEAHLVAAQYARGDARGRVSCSRLESGEIGAGCVALSNSGADRELGVFELCLRSGELAGDVVLRGRDLDEQPLRGSNGRQRRVETRTVYGGGGQWEAHRRGRDVALKRESLRREAVTLGHGLICLGFDAPPLLEP